MTFAWARSSVCINETTILFLFSRTKYEKSDDDASIAGSNHEHQVSQNSASCFEDNVENNLSGKPGSDVSGRNVDGTAVQGHQRRGSSSGNIIFPDGCVLPSKGEGDKSQNQLQNMSSCSGAPVPQALDDAPPEILSRASRTSGK
ncbi:uncharacterized protein LOC114317987 [Camellia sinensis]|uniref:uncharacterized protein LOC114317987 n=1 Tax=Camellia sinensis TaxID=4442 RepID=UPI001036538E|nr:uncharacterized protein LOC114317987 [Camellia sinensis]